jgi:hypothetical protein
VWAYQLKPQDEENIEAGTFQTTVRINGGGSIFEVSGGGIFE